MIKLNFNNDVLTLTTDCGCVVASGSLYQEADQVCEHNGDSCHCRYTTILHHAFNGSRPLPLVFIALY